MYISPQDFKGEFKMGWYISQLCLGKNAELKLSCMQFMQP